MSENIPKEKIKFLQDILKETKLELSKIITGMDSSIDAILLAIFSKGHVLFEGMPGLAKTLLAKSFAQVLDTDFQRIQFTPDLLPADLTGTNVFNPKTASFDVRKGPVFTGILLADEINRAPAKVQSALLQCMEERSVTIAEKTFNLDPNFFVLATQNPIDQEGTYQLPEAQTDRFMLKLKIGYPTEEEEIGIIEQHGGTNTHTLKKILKTKDRNQFTELSESVFVDKKLKDYIVRIVRESRPTSTTMQETKSYIRYGASPRASLAFLKIAKSKALIEGRDFVVPEDIQAFAKEILRHRILLTYEALAEDISVDNLVEVILESIGVP
jgi:MoxR-like ATPase